MTDQSVGEVDDEVETDVGQELLVDQFVDGSSPAEEDLVKTTKSAGVADISCVGHRHSLRLSDWAWTGLLMLVLLHHTAISTSQHRKQLELSWRALLNTP